MQSEKKSSNEPYLKNQYDENYLYSINRNSFVSKRSSDIFNNYFQKKFDKNDFFYIISGTDSGLLIKYLIDKGLSEGSRFLFVELEEHIDNVKKLIKEAHQDIIKVTTLDNWLLMAESMSIEGYIYQNNTFLTKSLSATDLFNERYHQINVTLEAELHEKVFSVKSSLGNQLFIDQQLKNLSENIIPLNKFKGTFKDKTCIILAGGPSLDDTLEWVRENRTKIIVIAVSRIARRLQNENLIPDIFVSVDPQHHSFEVSREMFNAHVGPLFIHTNNVSSDLLSQWRGKSVYLGDLVPWKSKLNVTNHEGVGPTVTNVAISAAIFLGIKTIYLTGVDLCNSSKGFSHASGSIEAETIGGNLAFVGVSALTYAGEVARTTIQMALAAKMLYAQAEQATKLDVKLFNLSSDATEIEHIKYIEKSSIILEKSNIPFNFVSNAFNSDITKTNKNHNQNILKEIDQLILDSNKINTLAKKALRHNEYLFDDDLSDSEAFTHKIKMDKIQNKLDKKYSIASNFIKTFGIQYFVKCVKPKNNNDWDNEKLKKIGDLYYQAYIKSSQLVLEKLKSTKERLLSRIEETLPRPGIKKIISQWTKDNQPGRSHILYQYLEANHSTPLTGEESEALKEQLKIFTLQLSSPTAFTKRLKRHLPSNEGIKRKILLFFKHKDIVNLQNLTKGLFISAEKNIDQEYLYYLSQAYLLSLNNQYEQSLLAFEDAGSEYLKEDEFLAITKIALKLQLPKLAESALSMLVTFNDIYLPQYANILKLAGKIEESIDCYIKYLQTYKIDIYNWLELGKLFVQIDASESAKMAFTKVLEIDPDNITGHEQLRILLK
jgi:hypothetical protein